VLCSQRDVTSAPCVHKRVRAIIVEAATIGRSLERPVLELYSSVHGTKFFETKILPLSVCASRINSRFAANSMIPEDQGEGSEGEYP